jgi:hypothetical protein
MAQDDATERWLPVVGWEGVYEVSDLGRLKRVGAHRTGRWPVGHILSGNALRLGYVSHHLTLGARKQTVRVHRVVMAAFVSPCPEGHSVNHLNGVKTDNRLVNLEYATPDQQAQHAQATGLVKRRTGEAHPNCEWSAADIASWGARYAAGETGHAIAADVGASRSTVYDAISGRRRRAGRVAPPVTMRAQTVGDADSQTRYHDATVRAWRRMYAEGVRCAVIARAYDTTTQAVWQIVTGKRRGHVKG